MKRRTSLITIAAFMIGAAPAPAQDPAPFTDFTFKREKVSNGGVGKRIRVQIDPSQEVFRMTNPSAAPLAEPETTEEPASLPFEWYWAAVSPKLASASSGRLEDAVNSLLGGPDGATVPTPRLQDMQNIASNFGKEILKATIGTKVSPALVLALIGIESGGRTAAVSSAGASGLMQLMPATAERFGVSDVEIPAENIRGGVAYLDWLMEEFGNDPVLILAAYNAGENAVKKHGGVPPYAETRAYVPKVLAAWTIARGLCLTPPQLISDGCVFATKRAASNG